MNATPIVYFFEQLQRQATKSNVSVCFVIVQFSSDFCAELPSKGMNPMYGQGLAGSPYGSTRTSQAVEVGVVKVGVATFYTHLFGNSQ